MAPDLTPEQVKKAERYQALQHAMQTGVMTEQARGSDDGSPKHLRVGVNSALVDAAALARLLVKKGVFTMDEYFDSLIEVMEEEVAGYEKRLSEMTGAKITLK